MLVIGCFGTIGLTVAGAIAGVMIGGTAAGRWGAAAGLLLGIAGRAGRDRGHGNSHDGFSLGMLARNWAVRLR